MSAGGRERIRLADLNSIRNVEYVFYWTFIAGVYWWGGLRVASGALSVGDLVVLVAYLGRLEVPVRRGMAIWSQVMQAAGALTKIRGFRESQLRIGPIRSRRLPESAISVPALEFRHVSFRYPGSAERTLTDVSFAVQAREFVALAGENGSGKSTVLSLALGLQAPDSGEILVYGNSLDELAPLARRNMVCGLLEAPFLLKGSIGENIRFGSPGASDSEVNRAASAAGIHDFVVSLPDGYETVLGENGAGLSAGQRQRLAIARLLVASSDLMLFDESTSALDVETDTYFRDRIREIFPEKSILLVSHSERWQAAADRVVRMKHGHILSAPMPAHLERDDHAESF